MSTSIQTPTDTTVRNIQLDAAYRRFQGENASVWDHPRAPRLESVEDRIIIRFAGETIADTTGGIRVLRPRRAPVYFIPPRDVQHDMLVPVTQEPIGAVFMPLQYWHVIDGSHVATCAAWSYPEPLPIFDAIRDYVAFDAAKMEACYVGDQWVLPDGERVAGGWITFDAQLVAAMSACGTLRCW